MTNTNQMEIRKNLAGKSMTITRYFDGSPEDVWEAWTNRDILDQWWAPKPWKAETSVMDFRPGGCWLYAMVGPDQSRHMAKLEFADIQPITHFSGIDYFCDENGLRNPDLPVMNWGNTFTPQGEGTTVVVQVTFSSPTDLETIVAMGFEAGFTAALTNLDAYLASGQKLRKELKNGNKPRVTTYLNFNGNTEEAFLFYKKVFNGKFTGKKLTHVGDVALPAEVPHMNEVDKKLILHAELEILGGHVLMATDAPESMGFKLHTGNNMHINVEPATREETERLFNELSEGGEIEMPLADMFFGAYYGSFTDKYGIKWMLHHNL
jgi:PhnB protein